MRLRRCLAEICPAAPQHCRTDLQQRLAVTRCGRLFQAMGLLLVMLPFQA